MVPMIKMPDGSLAPAPGGPGGPGGPPGGAPPGMVPMVRQPDGSLLQHTFERGDALVFLSHKYHSVSPVTAGTRQVLVSELWQGTENVVPSRDEKERWQGTWR